MARAKAIPEDRPLTAEERALIRWLLERGATARFLPQFADARAVSRCSCGCASVNLSVGGVVPPPGPLGILADFEYRTAEGRLCGAFVFERAGLLAGLEVWSVDGLSTPSALPSPAQLQPLRNVQHAAPDAAPDRRGM